MQTDVYTFEKYLTDTLIPDLIKSGQTFTAEDFLEALHWIHHLKQINAMQANHITRVNKVIDEMSNKVGG